MSGVSVVAVGGVQVNMTAVQQTVEDYISCMVMHVPGFSCPLATTIMAPDYTYNKATGTRSYAPRHYIGVLQYMPGVQLPVGKSNMARFLWSVMGLGSRSGALGASCDPFQNVCPYGQVRCSSCFCLLRGNVSLGLCKLMQVSVDSHCSHMLLLSHTSESLGRTPDNKAGVMFWTRKGSGDTA